MEIYLVGGAIRDQLLGLPVSERDWVVVGATPKAMTDLGYTQVGRDFPVFLHPESHEEYALARSERKTSPGYRGFEFQTGEDISLQEDLMRRDLTINALAQAEDGSLIDPYGGQRDLEARLLRHVSPAFCEDPVRVLRVARFAARFANLGFTVAEETIALMRSMVTNGEISSLVPERVWQETERALATDRPEVFFEVLRDCGALAAVFPEIDALFGVPQPAKWHPEIDTGIHTMMVIQQAVRLSSNVRVRFAALTHDLGKAKTPRNMWPRHRGHEEQSVRLVQRLVSRLRIPNDYRDLAVRVARFHGQCHRAAELRPRTILKVLEGTNAFRDPAGFELFLLACEADKRGRTGLEDEPYPQAELFLAAYRAATGVKVDESEAGLDGALIGERLRRRRTEAIASAIKESAAP